MRYGQQTSGLQPCSASRWHPFHPRNEGCPICPETPVVVDRRSLGQRHYEYMAALQTGQTRFRTAGWAELRAFEREQQQVAAEDWWEEYEAGCAVPPPKWHPAFAGE